MKPKRSVFDSDFRYTPASKTDIRKTFARIRREIEEQKKREAENNVAPLRRADHGTR